MPPRETAPPPVRFVPAVTVRLLLASSALSISPAGSETVPALTVRPLFAARLVKAPVLRVVAPTGVASTVPPEIVRLLSTLASSMEVPFQVPVVMVPRVVMVF